MNLWIIDDDSGICIFNQEFIQMPTKVNEDLIGGFLSAIRNFSEEVTGQNMRMIELDQIALRIKSKEKICFVAATSLDVKQKEMDAFLVKLEEKFIKRYQEVIDEDNINNVKIFEDFAVDVENEIGKESKYAFFFHEDPEVMKTRLKYAQENLEQIRKDIASRVLGFIDKSIEVPKETIQHLGLAFLKQFGKKLGRRKISKETGNK